MICASLNRAVFIKNLLRYLAEKILLLNTTNFRGDYHCISDFLGGHRQHLLQSLIPSGYIDIHNNLYFALFDNTFHFQWPQKNFENGLCVK